MFFCRLICGEALRFYSFLDRRCAVVEAILSGDVQLWEFLLVRLKQIQSEEGRGDSNEPNLLSKVQHCSMIVTKNSHFILSLNSFRKVLISV